jgi:hypothetical protein
MSAQSSDGSSSGITPPANTFGYWGDTNAGTGVIGSSATGTGIFGTGLDAGVHGVSTTSDGVHGESTSGPGVKGTSMSGPGVHGESTSGPGVKGTSTSIGGNGVYGENASGVGVYGTGADDGVFGISTSGRGVSGQSTALYQSAVYASSFGDHSHGVEARAGGTGSVGVYAASAYGHGVVGIAGPTGYGVYGFNPHPHTAGYFIGDVHVLGTLYKSTPSFKIDHPLDPANQYLFHSGVESPEMKNLYDGIAVLDAQGESIVELPLWFEALNQDFRYQLTPIGAAGPNLYIAEEISDRRFKIAGGAPGMKVCWQVTGNRKDAYAQANPLVVEQEKSAPERGRYLHPEVYGHSQEQSIAWLHHPEALRRSLEEQQQKTRKD